MTAAIDVADLSKTYPGDVQAVRGVAFRVEPGEVFGLLGPNGAGKSTTVGMLTTTIVPTAGTAALYGHDVGSEPRAARAIASVVFQEAVVDRSLTGRRHLDIHPGCGASTSAMRATVPPNWPARLGSTSCSTGRWGPTAAASGAGSRSPGRWCRARASSSSTSPPWASTHGSAPS